MKLKKEKIVKEIKEFELRHKITAFLIVMFLTIAITRILTFIHNPSPALFHFELHHFDYGVLLLIVTCLFVLLGKEKDGTYLILSGIAVGLIADDYWFIRTNILEPATIFEETKLYNSTFPQAILFGIVVALIIIIINSILNRKRKEQLDVKVAPEDIIKE